MLKILEIATPEELTAKYQNDTANDYLYFLKFSNTIMFTDNGVDKYFNSVMECTQAEYEALTTKRKCYYLVLQPDNSYKCYFETTLISDTKQLHNHANMTTLDKLGESNGTLLFDGNPIQGGGGTTDLTAIQAQIDNLEARSVFGDELDLIQVYSTTTQNVSAGSIVAFSTVVPGTKMTYDLTNYTISLKKNRKYRIRLFARQSTNSGYSQINMSDITNNIQLPRATAIPTSPNYASSWSSIPDFETTYIAPNDCKIQAKVSSAASGCIDLVNIIVEETGRVYLEDPSRDILWGEFGVTANTDAAANTKVILSKVKDGNMSLSNGAIHLTGGKTYRISVTGPVYLTGYTGGFYFNIVDTSNNILKEKIGYGVTTNYTASPYGETSIGGTYDATADIDISISCDKAFTFYDTAVITVQEVARPIVTDYIKNNFIDNPLTNGELCNDVPVGSIILHLGTTPPAHYLEANGAILQILQYQDLADAFATNLGASNYFGGDGITTFALPDARGEFIRGYDGTALRDPNGATRGVGKHQDGTSNLFLGLDGSMNLYSYADSSFTPSNYDKVTKNVPIASTNGRTWNKDASWQNGSSSPGAITSRPTNINMLVCIKYEPTFYAVNQYGGFCEEVLFDGNANVVGTYTLADSIENYNYVQVVHTLDLNNGNTNVLSKTLVIPVNVINYSKLYQFVYDPIAFAAFQYHFSSNNQLSVDYIYFYNAVAIAARITKIIGVKGSIPTFVSGGEF